MWDALKQIGDGWRAAKIQKAMRSASVALTAGKLDVTNRFLHEAYSLLLETT
jgi:hypothetical protein